MTGEERREKILKLLKEQGTPLSGAALAQRFRVSRQVIVEDITLMRAESTPNARDFVRRLAACRDTPLKVLTGDCHYHTVAAPSEKLLDLIAQELKDKGFIA